MPTPKNTSKPAGDTPPIDATTKRLAKLETELHREFHSRKKTRAIVKKKKLKPPAAGGGAPSTAAPGPAVRPPGRVDCEFKKALVVLGCLTGNAFVDAAFRNTANEAVSDFTNRGYRTTLLVSPTSAQVQAFLVDPCVKAFAYVGHGSDSDSGDSTVGGKDGSDFLWPNCDEVITSTEVARWMNGGQLEVVILHACFQGSRHTRRRWRKAFGVPRDSFHSWEGQCRYFTAYWWQLFWF